MMQDNNYKQTNREKKMQPKLGKAYCGACDGALVGDGQKCPRCGAKHKTKKLPRRDHR